MNRRAFLATSAAVGLSACASTRSGDWAMTADIDRAVAAAMALDVTPGLAVAVYSREGVYARGFGVADAGMGQAVSADTAFYIASSTKPLTALMLTRLHHAGAFDLDATLTAYAPDAPFPATVGAGETTFRQMLSHTSGIDNGPVGFRSAYTGQHDPEMLWRLLSESEVNAEAPRGQFDYTNVGYNITTVLTDRRIGVAWQELLQREVFAPAGMTRTSARMSQAHANRWSLARPHGFGGDGALERQYLEKTDATMQSAGGIIMSANDAVRWLELMIEGGRGRGRRVIAPEVVAAVQTPIAQVNEEFDGYERQSYALGWYIGPYRGERMLQHFGGFAGFRAHVSFLPERGVGVAAFANSGVGGITTDAVANYIYDLMLGGADAQQRLDEALAAGASRRQRIIDSIARGRADRASRAWTLTRPRAAYAGAYESDAWGRIEVTAVGDELRVAFGALRATGEPFTQPESMRVELVPGQGEPLVFEGDGETPDAVRTRTARFTRV